ncbi:MAG TPA: vitamin B12-dependent ribonucleotide reductase, partial [Candidatus Kapabacteria bacterium]|nr:vitamin B12-dependent ribonucleotide reductase [Candidatus Kapabacteria bacterium]
VLMAQFTSSRIAILFYFFRTLGLGYANLGALRMVHGIPYDSPEALAWTGAISAIMTGEAYATSAEMASELGAFPAFEANREDMLRVIRNHRRAAYNAMSAEYENLTIKPMGINPRYCPEYLLNSAREVWDVALQRGEKYGYRNAQVSVIAPTGTIGLLMDCDTTGIEPDFAVVKYKKLAGGGYFKIINQSIRKALTKLGYSKKQIDEIEKYTIGHGTLSGCPHINKQSLKAKGFTQEKIDIVEKELANVFDIRFAFNKWTLGEDFLLKLGISQEEMNSPNFDLLKRLGYKDEEIEQANDYVCGTMMIEGAPHLKEEDLPIFDTANKCGKRGQRFISPMAHIRIMAAAQPFISGAISKTVNLPSNSTVADIGDIYLTSWKYMLKAIALYRDGSKLSQPLNSANFANIDEVVTLGDENTLDETKGPREVQEIIADRIHYKLVRHKLPKKRRGHIREALIGGHKVFLRTGEYEDGSLGEIFIDMYKEGASFRALMNSFAILTSKALQYGVPLEDLVETFTFTRFEPSGPVEGHEAIKFATSVLDFVFRSLGYDYLNRTDFVHVKAVDEVPGNGNGKNGNGHTTDEPATDERLEEKDKANEINNSTPDETISNIKTNEDAELVPEEVAANPKTNGAATASALKTSAEARSMGYTGEYCVNCGSMKVKRNGSCTVCEDCGSTSGCS